MQKNKVLKALKLIFSLKKPEKRVFFVNPFRFEKTAVNRFYHPFAKAQWREKKNFFGRHIIQYNGHKMQHIDFGNPRRAILPRIAHVAEGLPVPMMAAGGAYVGGRFHGRAIGRKQRI